MSSKGRTDSSQSKARRSSVTAVKGLYPYLTVLGLFILCSNLMGLVPGFEAPTGVVVAPLGCAVLTFLYYNFHGVKRQGLGHYLRHFAGPSIGPWWANLPMAILMVPIEVVSHLARVLSLTVRLYANMFAGDMVTMVFFSLVPIGLPIIFMLLHLGVSVIQTYVFVLLAMDLPGRSGRPGALEKREHQRN